ncbi:hypothetical protein NQZ79_g7587 [Umbelopsis isabellina]|nr:hypothetical protein NQZ79_g7587 [Umbelopsis isabellina]
MVYLLVKHLDDLSGDHLMRGSHIYVGPSTRLYAGQTMNFRRRELNRHGHLMTDSNIKICIGHNLTHYQMDCLEATLIAFLLLKYGLRTTNRTVYPRFVYNNIPRSLDIDDRSQHPSSVVHGIHTISLVSRVLIVGTAPPVTMLNNPEYQRNLQEWISQVNQGTPISNPPVDVMTESDISPTLRFLRDLVQEDPIDPDQGSDLMQVEPGYIPDFIDHYPDVESDNYRGLARAVSVEQIRLADRNVRQSIQQLNRDIIIMLGARPTFLYPHRQRRHYFAEVCPFVDLIWMTPYRCGFVFWWPHPGLRRYTTVEVRQLLEQLFLLLAHKLHLLLWKLKSERPYPFGPFTEGSYGVSEEQGYAIIDWLANQAVSLQILGLYKKLSNMWTTALDNIATDDIYSYNSIIPFNGICKYDMLDNRVMEDDPVITLFPERLQQELPAMTLAEVSRTWSATTTSRLTNYCLRRIANYNGLPETEQAHQLQLAARYEYDRLMRVRLNQYIERGLFVPFENEEPREQWSRWWRSYNMELMLRGTNEGSSCYTCCWCSQLAMRTPPDDQGKVNFSTVKVGCPNGMAHSLGWSIVPGDYSQQFPGYNIFALFLESLPSAIVINSWQLAHAFADFLSLNVFHPQGRIIYEKYKHVFGAVRNYTRNENNKGHGSAFVLSLTKAMAKLTRLDPPHKIQLVVRDKYEAEKRGIRTSGQTRTLFAIRMLIDNEETLKSLEDLDFLEYRQAFRWEVQAGVSDVRREVEVVDLTE